MSHLKSKIDSDTLAGIIGIIATIAIPLIIIYWPNNHEDTPTTDTTPTYMDYDEWKAEQRQNEADEAERLREQELEGY